MQGSNVRSAVGERVDEKESLAAAAPVAYAESRKLGLAAGVVVIEVDEEGDEALAALADMPLVVRHVGVDEIEVLGDLLADVVVQDRHRFEVPERHAEARGHA